MNDKLVELMAKFIENKLGTCPNDMFGFENDCEHVCGYVKIYECWIDYFKEQL